MQKSLQNSTSTVLSTPEKTTKAFQRKLSNGHGHVKKSAQKDIPNVLGTHAVTCKSGQSKPGHLCTSETHKQSQIIQSVVKTKTYMFKNTLFKNKI